MEGPSHSMSTMVSHIESKVSGRVFEIPWNLLALKMFRVAPMELLQDATSANAFHNSGERRDPPRCHRDTRVAILEKIMRWINTLNPFDLDRILWLYGPAGAGKSAIAQSIADICYSQGLILATYFFSRLDPTRNHARSLVFTISYQIAANFPGARNRILDNIHRDPLIIKRTLETQIASLIIDPLQPLVQSGYFALQTSKRLIVIDGLDECIQSDEQVEILDAISVTLQKSNLPLLFLIACRPEHDIQYAFRTGYLQRITTLLPLDDEYQAYLDIQRYLWDNLSILKETHPFRHQIPTDWPRKDIIERLVAKSSGQFIYAATVVKFVSSSRHCPTSQLEIALGIRSPNSALPFSELDALYTHILSSLENPYPVLHILAFHILSKSKQVEIDQIGHMENILSMLPGDADIALCDLGSILKIAHHSADSASTGARNRKLHIFHASLEDFLLDKSRSGPFYIDAPSKHSEFAIAYMKHFSKTMEVLHLGSLFYLNCHIKEALPTCSLREEIIKFSEFVLAPDVPKSRQCHALYINNDLLGFLETISESKFVDSKALREVIHKQLNLCDEEESFLDTLFVGL